MATTTKQNNTPGYDVKTLNLIIDFLKDTGIEIHETELDDGCFLLGLYPKGCGLLIDRNKLKYPGDLLHEAGHIAVTEAHLRPLIGTPEMPEQWPKTGDELGAILWSYAAVCKLKIPADVVFHPDGYKGDSAWLIEQFENGNYIGLPLLTWMGFCNVSSDTSFPFMNKWLR